VSLTYYYFVSHRKEQFVALIKSQKLGGCHWHASRINKVCLACLLSNFFKKYNINIDIYTHISIHSYKYILLQQKRDDFFLQRTHTTLQFDFKEFGAGARGDLRIILAYSIRGDPAGSTPNHRSFSSCFHAFIFMWCQYGTRTVRSRANRVLSILIIIITVSSLSRPVLTSVRTVLYSFYCYDGLIFWDFRLSRPVLTSVRRLGWMHTVTANVNLF
jgi:hypothetical protein